MLQGLDSAHVATFTTVDSMRRDGLHRIVEHVVPMKRIVVEIVDPRQADPRSNSNAEPIAGGPAMSVEHLILIFDQLLVKCWVTADEHYRLNRTGPSFQRDATEGYGWSRFAQGGVLAHRLTANGDLPED